VKRAHPESGVDLTFIKLSGESNGDAGDPYIGLDRFGRTVDHRWTTGTTTKDHFQYGHDRNSNPLYKENMVEATRSELFAYDGFNQLTNFSRGTLNTNKDGISGTASRTQSWDFDALGNVESRTTNGTAETRSHNKQNELTAASGQTSPTYDANGNQTNDLAGLGYKFDAWDRLVEVTSSGGGAAIRTYHYDALGRRIQETAGGTTTDFYYSAAWQVLEERVGSAAKISYVWSPVYVEAMIARDRDTDANGSLDERLYPMHDANFNVTGLVNTSGTAVERFANDAFGLPTFSDASYGTRSSSSYGWNYLHQGLRWDGTIGKYWNRRRDFDPVQGRFTSVDPLRFGAGDVDFYRYEGNAPVAWLDSSGLDYRSDFWDGFGKSGRGSDLFSSLKTSSSVHHTKPQILRSLYDHLGINIDSVDHLRGVQRGEVHQSLTNQQRQFIQSEMDQCGKGWKYAKVDDVKKFIDTVKNDQKFIDRLNTFTDTQAKLAEEAGVLYKNNLTGRQVTSQFNRMDGRRAQVRAVLSVKGFGSKVLPRAAGALAIFSVLVPAQVVCAGHNKEQEAAFTTLMARYESAYATAVGGGTVDQLQLQNLQGDFIAYLKTLGVSDEALAVVAKGIAIYLADQ